MTLSELSTFLNKNVRVIYNNKIGEQSRTGWVYALTTRKLVLLSFPGSTKHTGPTASNPFPIDTEGEDHEIYCNIRKIKNIKEIKGG